MGKKKNNNEAPSSLSDILNCGLIKDIKKKATVDEKVRKKWSEVVGDNIASMSRVVLFSRGVLQVEVNSSALLSELDGIYKKELILSLGEGEDPVDVNHITFKLSGGNKRF